MLYFLVIVLPVAIGILYLIHRNNQLKKIYDTIASKIQELYLFDNTPELIEIDSITNNYIVRTEGIQKLENALVQLEIHLDIKYKVISKTYTPKIEMLKNLSKRIDRVENKIQKNEAIGK